MASFTHLHSNSNGIRRCEKGVKIHTYVRKGEKCEKKEGKDEGVALNP